MNTTTRTSTAQRFGLWLGRGWRAYARGEQQVTNWLGQHGIPAPLAKGLQWAVKLGVFAVLFYVAFWLALPLAFLVTLAWGNLDEDQETPEPEWKQGAVGFGLYTYDDYRIDPHDPRDEV